MSPSIEKYGNIISAFFDLAAKRGSSACFHVKRDGRWNILSWIEVATSVKTLASALLSMGLKKGERVLLVGSTRAEWTVADCAVLAIGAVTVPVYPTMTADRVASIIRDSEPRFAIVERGKDREVILEAERILGLERSIQLISFDPAEGIEDIGSLVAKGGAGEEIEGIAGKIQSDDLATIVFTSGTTGEQKGCLITHANMTAEIRGAMETFDFKADEIGLLWLPLAHVLGRMIQFYHLLEGCQTAFAESVDHLSQNYLEVRPHFVCGVPRMVEKIHEGVEAYATRLTGRRKRFFNWALKIGRERSELLQKLRPVPISLAIQYRIADLFLFKKFRAKLGGRVRKMIIGGASLSEAAAEFMHACDILMIEGYGLTETFAAATCNRSHDYHFGTVGKPLPGVEVKLAQDGEVLIRGPIVFKGYVNRPNETLDAFDADGWLKTGDLGSFSRDGFLRLTGRKKDVIITSSGKNIAPQMIEKLMSDSPYIANFLVYGDGRKYLTALVSLNRSVVQEKLEADGIVIDATTRLSELKAVRDLISAHISERNTKLAPFETIKKFAICDGDFSADGGELTPTLKARRGFIGEKYRELLATLYI